jgi:N-acetylglucosaminyldiphosphoundecaprenol N-acetyl-beta-D-mannosaminyltransferase
MGAEQRKCRLFGISVDNLTMSEAVSEIEEFIEARRPCLVVTPNAHHITLLRSNADFRAAYAAADLVLADSVPLIWSSRLLGFPLRERVPGSEIPTAFSAAAAQKSYRLFFLGAAPGIAQRASDILARTNPGLRVAGVHAPPQGFERRRELNDEIVRKIGAAKPDVLFVALGSPKGEIWAARHKDAVGVPVTICCGAAFDFIAGNKKRAPRWLQKLGLEWLFRVIHEPRRLWKRYLVGNAHFVFLLARELLRKNRESAIDREG